MTRNRLEPFFLDSSGGRIFVLLRAAPEARRCILIVPPFGEEMNKTRRQFTMTAQALVDRGFAVLLPDLYGTGDSEGEFGDATWEHWMADIHAALDWIECNNYSLGGIVAVRLGCTLAADCLRDAQYDSPCSIFWQPVDSGRQFMTQFLRLRVAASMMESGDRETVDRLKQRLQDGRTLEVAGYKLTPKLWKSIESVDLSSVLDTALGKLAVFEVGRVGTGDMSPVGKRLIARALELGVATIGERVNGDPFWSAAEIIVNEELVRRTVECVAGELA